MKKLEEKDFKKYVIHPSVAFYGGYIHTGEDIDLCDDEEKMEEEKYYWHVKQWIRDNKLYTDLHKEFAMIDEKNVVEDLHQEVELKPNQLLVYVPTKGFTISEYKMVTIEEAQQLYELIK